MGLLSTLFGLRPKTTKMEVARLAASTIDCVIIGPGVGMLVAGSLVLDKNLHPSFRSGVPNIGGDILAVVAIGDLEQADKFKTLGDDMRDSPILEYFVDMLVYAALREFEGRCPAFATLPEGDRHC